MIPAKRIVENDVVALPVGNLPLDCCPHSRTIEFLEVSSPAVPLEIVLRVDIGRVEVVDEAPTALPIGFLYAGASSVVASLWNVNDESTARLMAEFYGRLIQDGSARTQDRLRALHDAKRALRASRLSPYHWAPFLYFGSPD